MDNLNNIATADKVTVTKGVNSPQVAGNHVIPVRNRPNFVRMLNFVSTLAFCFLYVNVGNGVDFGISFAELSQN